MKALVLQNQGGLSGLVYTHVAMPEVRAGEALIRMAACSLNRADLFAVQGIKGMRPRLPFVLGRDIAGDVVEIRSDSSTDVKIGDRVLVVPQVTCGSCDFCIDGRENMCQRAQTVGASRPGGLAEYVAVPLRGLHPLTGRLTAEQAATLPTAWLTAYHMLRSRAQVRPGETVLVIAAGSGVGAAAVQIARRFGAEVIATAGTESKLAMARDLGAFAAVNHHEVGIAEKVMGLTDGRGVDVVIDHVGTAVWNECFALLRPGGRLVNAGVTSGHEVELHLGQLFTRNISIIGSTMGTRAEMRELLKLVEQGDVMPIIDSVFPLRDGAQAFQKMLDSTFFGKLVVIP